MALYKVVGEPGKANHELVRKALDSTPALLVDAANCANIHAFSDVELQNFSQVYVVEAESLYRFAPALRRITLMSDRLGIRKVFITTFTRLFSYDDEEENANIFTDAWRSIAALSKDIDITVAVEQGTIHESLAKIHGAKEGEIMGHTVMSQRIMTDAIVQELAQFGKALDADNREVYNRILAHPLKHLGTISYTSSMHTWAVLLLTVLLEQQKKMDRMENEIARMAD